ncbi:MAG: hypothetical protein Q7R45_08410 [Sulfuricaulis sp.]|nr:hypothetical protein [Sulfuricaulis sp.]
MRHLLAALALAVSFSAAPADATWKPEYAQAPQAVRDWYSNAQLTPAASQRLKIVSCCASSDVVRAQFRVEKKTGRRGDEWWYLAGATWKRVPPDIIHWDEHAPDGMPTLFILSGSNVETCFYPPDGGI